MKKITFLLSLIFACLGGVSAYAQITSLDELSNNKCYTLTAKRGYLSTDDNNKTMYGFEGTPDKTKTNTNFVIYKAGDGQYYLWNVGQMKFVSALSTTTANTGLYSMALLPYAESYYKLNRSNSDEYPWYMTAPENGNQFMNMAGNRNCLVDNWNTQDDGNRFKIEEVGDFNGDIVAKALLVNKSQMVYLKCERGYMYSNAEHTKLVTTDRNATPNGDDYKFVFFPAPDGNLYLWNVGASNFVQKLSGTDVGFSDSYNSVAFTPNTGNATYYFNLTLDGSKLNHNNSAGAGDIVTGWEDSDAGNQWTIEAADGTFDSSICLATYYLITASTTISQENLLGGYTTADLAPLKSAYEAAKAKLTTENANTLIDAVSTLHSKSTISISNDKVFMLKNAHPTEKRGYLVLDDDAPSFPNLASVEYPNDNMKAGYKQIGDAKVHAYWGVYTSKETGKMYLFNIANGKFLKTNGSNIDFGEEALAITLPDNTTASLSRSIYTEGATTALCMACGRASYTKKSIIYSGNGSDGGNPIYFIYQADQTIPADLLKVIEGEVYLAEHSGSVQGFVGAFTTETATKARTLLTGENRTAANAEAVMSYPLITLKDGGYYHIINAVPGFNKKKGLLWDGSNTVWNTVENSNVNAIYQIIADNGKYVFKSVNAEKYIQGVAGAMNPNMTANGHVELVPLAPAQFNLKFGNGTMHANNHGGGTGTGSNVISYNGNANSASAWFIEPVESVDIPLNTAAGASYATAYLPFSVSSAEGADLYTGVVNGDVLNLTKSHEGVAAEQAIVLIGESGAEKATVKIGEGTATSTGIDGTLTPKTVAAKEVLTLGKSGDEVGFFAFTGTQVAANKAYINGTSGVQGVRFIFDDVTGIHEAVTTDADNAPIYDLSGRRVVKTVKGGLYIQNGKKFIVR